MALTYKEGSFKNKRGHQLHTVSYVPNAHPIKSIVVWHHGYGEHVGRYKAFFTRLADSGHAVYSFDAHGHGRSEPLKLDERCFVKNFSDFVDDTCQYVTDIKALHEKTPPLIIGGNSMGGLIAAYTALRDQSMWAGLILCSAALDVEWTLVLRIQAPLGDLLAKLVPRARLVPAVRNEDMSQDADVVKDYVEDPLNFVGNVRAKTGNEILKAFNGLKKSYKTFTLPIFALHGDTDRCTSLKAVKVFMDTVASTDKKIDVVKGGYHEILLGPEKDECILGIISWLDLHSLPEAKM